MIGWTRKYVQHWTYIDWIANFNFKIIKNFFRDHKQNAVAAAAAAPYPGQYATAGYEAYPYSSAAAAAAAGKFQWFLFNNKVM